MMFAAVSAAGAYISAVETALGSSITSTQKGALNAFVLAEQAAGRWTSHKRLYLPIWANAAANAICLKSLASGTFAGTVTHGAGYVQGDGSTGYFDTGLNMRTTFAAAPGADAAVGAISCLCYAADSRADRRVYMGAQSGSDSGIVEQITSAGVGGRAFSTHLACSGSTRTGVILVCSRTGRADRYVQRLTSGGLTTANDTVSNPVYASSNTLTLMARNAGASRDLFFNGKIGSGGVHYEMTEASGSAYIANLKTLWETCTGLTLP